MSATDTKPGSGWLSAGLGLGFLLIGLLVVASGAPIDLLAVAPLGILLLGLATQRYFGVETALRLAARYRTRLAGPPKALPRPVDVITPAVLELLEGTRALRAPPVPAPALG